MDVNATSPGSCMALLVEGVARVRASLAGPRLSVPNGDAYACAVMVPASRSPAQWKTGVDQALVAGVGALLDQFRFQA